MAKKNSIRIERNDGLKSIDDELDEAMGNLSGVNQRVNDLLDSYDGGEPLPMEEYASDEDASPKPLGDAVVPKSNTATDEFESDDEDDDDEFLDEDDEFEDDEFDEEDEEEDYEEDDEDELDDDE